MKSFDLDALLKLGNTAMLNEFLHECVDDLIGKRKANFENYSSGNIDWKNEDYDLARKCVQNLYRQSVIEDNFQLSNDVAETLQKSLKDCYEIRKSDIFQTIAEECILKGGHNLVVNIDWKLKWILGTSQLATIREPLLQLDLHCKKANGNSTVNNIINLETNLEQVDALISELSKFQKVL